VKDRRTLSTMGKVKIAIIGTGNMGEVLIAGILSSGIVPSPKYIIGSDIRKERRNYIRKKYKITITENNTYAVKNSNIVILSVKPQQIKEVLEEIKGNVTRRHLIISIVAGLTIKNIQKMLNDDKLNIIRVMPNTPCLAKVGMSVLSFSKNVPDRHATIAKKIFSSLGEILILPERHMDAVTAISGSGPAYIFYLAELMMAAAKKLNLPKTTIALLVKQTVLGAAVLMKSSAESPEVLRMRVTSPGGTTEAAIKYMENNNLPNIIINGIECAANRAKELSKYL